MKDKFGFKKYLLIVSLGFLSLAILSSYIINTFFDPSLALEAEKALQTQKKEGIIYLIMGVVIIHPLVETFFFQVAPIELTTSILKKVKYNKILAILFSAILFGLAHHYSSYYKLVAFINGIALAFIYIETEKRYDKLYAMCTVFFVHALSNFMATMLFLFFP